MDSSWFDRLTRQPGGKSGRRRFIQAALVLGGAAPGLARPQRAAAINLCRRDGSRCTKQSSTCRAKFCLKPPFTIEAIWSSDSSHDIYLFVPKQSASGPPGPYIQHSCNPEVPFYETCDTEYPFVCANGEHNAGGDEIATVYKLLPGLYEFWVDLLSSVDRAPGDLTVKVRNPDGRVLRSWKSPAFTSAGSHSWHVCNIAGGKRSLKSIDVLESDLLPDVARYPNTDVCPEHH